MKTPLRSASFASLIATGGALFAAALWSRSGATLDAQNAPPAKPPLISLSVKRNQGDYTVAVKAQAAQQGKGGGGGGQGGGGGGPGGGGKGGNTASSDAKGKSWIEITVRNLGTPVTGLVVNWNVYVKTSTAAAGSASISWSSLTGSKTVDIDANKTTLVVSDPVSTESDISSTMGGGGGGGGGKRGGGGGGGGGGSSSSTAVQLWGYYVSATYDDKPVGRPSEDPMNAKATFTKNNGG
jgi:hypothetical protein